VNIIAISRCGFIDLCITLHHLQIGGGWGGPSRPIVISGRLWIVSGKALDEISQFIRVFNNLHLPSKLIFDQSKYYKLPLEMLFKNLWVHLYALKHYNLHT
jgi:hypothetical protein